MDFSNLWKHFYNSLMLLFTKYECMWLTAISMSLSRCITYHDVYVQQSHATNRLLPWCKVNFWRFVAMLLLRYKDQQQNNPLATFATNLCRQRRVHEWTASSSLHDTISVNLTLVECEFHTVKKTVIARIKSINRNQDADFSFFQKCLVLWQTLYGLHIFLRKLPFAGNQQCKMTLSLFKKSSICWESTM